MLRWTFGVLYAELAFCLPGLSLWYVLFLAAAVVMGVTGVGIGTARMAPLSVDLMEMVFLLV